MKTLLMLCGLPASGKSTFREKFRLNNPGYVEISSDDYIDDVAAKQGKTYSEVFKEAVKDAETFCMETFHYAIENGANVIIDRTNMTDKARRKFLSHVPKDYYKIAGVFAVPEDVLASRLLSRFEATGKFIPPFVIATMRQSYVAPTIAEFDMVLEF